MNMGYRVYDTASSTRPRMHRDYEDVKFELLSGSAKVQAPDSAQTVTIMAATALTTLALFAF